MKFVWYLLAGVCGGVLAGMGMGGGTLTIPILVLLLSAGQLTAQFANLVAFLPTGAAALGMHLRGGLVKGAPPSSSPRSRQLRRRPFSQERAARPSANCTAVFWC